MERTKNSLGFWSNRGVAVPAVTADQMAEIDRIAIEESGPNLFQMMENAGRNMAQLLLRRIVRREGPSPVLVLAGVGGNGGGGISAARHLANHGIDTTVVVMRSDRLSAAVEQQLELFRLGPGRIATAGELERMEPAWIVDALIGYSLRGPVRDNAARLISWANARGTPVASLDLPSGTDATSGESEGITVRPKLTLTLALPKTGLAHAGVGELYLGDIGIPPSIYHRLGLPYDNPFGRSFVVRLRRVTGRPQL